MKQVKQVKVDELDVIDDDLSTGDYVPIYLGYRKLTMDRLVELTIGKLV